MITQPVAHRRPGSATILRSGRISLAAAVLLGSTLTGTASTASAAPALAPLLGPAAATSSRTAAADVVPGSYIVVLKDAHGPTAAGVRAGSVTSQVTAAAARARSAGGAVGHTYASVLRGYSATLDNSALTAVRQDPAVKYVQPTRRVHVGRTGDAVPAQVASVRVQGAAIAAQAAAVPGPTRYGESMRNPSWGLDRIDQRNLPLDRSYYWTASGTINLDPVIRAFVVDTGIYAGHPDFASLGGRVLSGIDEVGDTDGTTDCNGHGTHVAGTIGGSRYGVAKRVALVPVRVLDCAGNGTSDDILAGLEWIRSGPLSKAVAGGETVVNLSLEGDFDQALNDGVEALVAAGIPVVVAAGNGDQSGTGVSACSESPASAPGAVTVAASTSKDRAASFSNFGTCVDLYAPGENITSDVPGKADGQFWYNTFSGTSMAAPHVTGAIAMYLEFNRGATPAQISAMLSSTAIKAKITGVDVSFPRDLLFALQPVPISRPVTGGDRLQELQALPRGVRLYSKNRAYFLAHRSRDGWLCLYNASTGKVAWATGHSAAFTILESSGWLTSSDQYGRRTWTSGRNAYGDSTMVVNDKGYVMIRQQGVTPAVVWTSPH